MVETFAERGVKPGDLSPPWLNCGHQVPNLVQFLFNQPLVYIYSSSRWENEYEEQEDKSERGEREVEYNKHEDSGLINE